MEGAPAPNHATFPRFRSVHFAPCFKRILAKVSNALFDLGEISGETIFIDGTKIEASANKYTFVWKEAVTKNLAKLLIKLADFVAECEHLYDSHCDCMSPNDYEKLYMGVENLPVA